MAERTFISDFKRNSLAGLAALFPILITVFLLSWVYVQLDRTIGRRVNGVCRAILVSRPGMFQAVFRGAPPEVVSDPEQRRQYAQDHFPRFVGVSISIVGALVGLYLVGFLLRSYLGARVMGFIDRFFERFPVVKAIYPHARQVAEVLFGPGRRMGFRHVVAVEYPRRGVYSVGFRTGPGLRDVEQRAGRELTSVFIPTSPTPLTGFIILVPPSEVLDLEMTVEEAFRFCMTAGMVAGARQREPVSSQLRAPGSLSGTATEGAQQGASDGGAGPIPRTEP